MSCAAKFKRDTFKRFIMKKLYFILAAGLFIMATSCKKDWECHCIKNDVEQLGFVVESQTKEVAEKHCNNHQRTLNENEANRASCEVK